MLRRPGTHLANAVGTQLERAKTITAKGRRVVTKPRGPDLRPRAECLTDTEAGLDRYDGSSYRREFRIHEAPGASTTYPAWFAATASSCWLR
jgi:hypothetical protein